MIKRVLKPGQADIIYSNALKTLSEIGIYCKSGLTAKRLSEYAKVVYKNERLFLDAGELDEFFQCRKRELCDGEDNAFHLSGHWHSWYLCDPATNRPRPADEADCIRMAKLSEGLGSRSSPIPVGPDKVPARLHTMACERIALQNTRHLGGRLTATDEEEIKILLDMYDVAGRKYSLALEPFISPLRLNYEVMDVYFRWKDDPRVHIEVFSGIPMAGATAPLINPAALTLSFAEGLAQEFLFNKLSQGKIQTFHVRLEPFDMKHFNMTIGTPEWCLYKQSIIELLRDLGVRKIGGSFRTNSRIADAQALVERTASFIWQAALGARSFGAMGQLCLDEVFSPVQAIIDKEILKYGQRLFAETGIPWDHEQDALEVIREGIANDGFVMLDSTLDNLYATFNYDTIFNSKNVNTWLGEGSVSTEALANEKAEAIISQYDFVMDDRRKAEIDKLYRQAADILQ